jgi:hypothetical protein
VAQYEQLTRLPGAKGLVDAFLEARLFTGGRDAVGYATVMVAHEALLRVWQRVGAWVRDNRDFLRQRARLGQALEQWKTRDGHEDYLLARGLPLVEAESLLRQHGAALSGEEVAFIRASQVRAQREERRRTNVRRAVIAGLIMLIFLACVACLVAFWQWKQAEEALTKSFVRTIGISSGDSASADERAALWELSELAIANHQNVRKKVIDSWVQKADYMVRALAHDSRGLHAAIGLNATPSPPSPRAWSPTPRPAWPRAKPRFWRRRWKVRRKPISFAYRAWPTRSGPSPRI